VRSDELEPAPSPGSKRKHGDDSNSFDDENPCSEPSRSSRPFFALQPSHPDAIRGSLPKRTASIDCKKGMGPTLVIGGKKSLCRFFQGDLTTWVAASKT
jgi:hypothetical protein